MSRKKREQPDVRDEWIRAKRTYHIRSYRTRSLEIFLLSSLLTPPLLQTSTILAAREPPLLSRLSTCHVSHLIMKYEVMFHSLFVIQKFVYM